MSAPPGLGDRSLLCAGCGDRACRLRHSQLKPLLFSFTAVKRNGFGTFSLQDASGAQEAQDSLQELPWSLQMPPRCLPDGSKMLPRASRYLRCFPDASQDCLQELPWSLQMSLRCLPDGSKMLPRASRYLPDASRCLQDASRCFPDASQISFMIPRPGD